MELAWIDDEAMSFGVNDYDEINVILYIVTACVLILILRELHKDMAAHPQTRLIRDLFMTVITVRCADTHCNNQYAVWKRW